MKIYDIETKIAEFKVKTRTIRFGIKFCFLIMSTTMSTAGMAFIGLCFIELGARVIGVFCLAVVFLAVNTAIDEIPEGKLWRAIERWLWR